MPPFLSVLIPLSVFFAGVTVLSALLTRGMILLSPRWKLVDYPSDRRIHSRPIPRAGGIAVFLSMVTGLHLLPLLGFAGSAPIAGDDVLYFTFAAGLIVGIGVIDDRHGMSAWVKLAGQMLAAAIYFFHDSSGGGSILGYPIPWWCDLGIHVVWTVVLINGFNLIDGMDGLCAGLGLIASSILGILAVIHGSVVEAMMCGVMSFSLLGFLVFNFHPARIFLGDAGSMLIGFFIATAGASAAGRSTVAAAILLPLLIGGVPLLDVALAVWRRGAKRFQVSKPGVAATRIFGPDRHHIHHRLLDWGFTQRRATFVIYGLAIVLAAIGLLPIIGGVNWLALSLIGLLVSMSIGIRYLAPVELITSGNTLRALVRRPLPSRLYAFGYFVYDLLALAVAAVFSWWLLGKVNQTSFEPTALFGGVAIFTGCGLLALRLSRAQTRRWSRACVYEFSGVLSWLCCGFGISYVLQSWSMADFMFIDATRHIVAGAAAVALIFLPRSVSLYLMEGVIDTMHRKRRLRSKTALRTTVLYGAGDLGELFLSNLRLSSPEAWKDDHIIGFLDDNPALTGRWLRGFVVLGTADALAELSKRHGFDTVMITQSTLSPEKLAGLEERCRTLRLNLRIWSPSLGAEILHTAPMVDSAGGETPIPNAPRQGRVDGSSGGSAGWKARVNPMSEEQGREH